MPLSARLDATPSSPVRADLVCSRVRVASYSYSYLACWCFLAPPVVSVFRPLRSWLHTHSRFLAFVRVGPLRCSLSCPNVPLVVVQRTGCSAFGLGYPRRRGWGWAPPMYIPLISVSAAAALILVVILFLVALAHPTPQMPRQHKHQAGFHGHPGKFRGRKHRPGPGFSGHNEGATRCKGGAELPLPALRRQAPRWARGWVGDPGAARPRTPPTSAPFAKKSRFQDVKPALLPPSRSYKPPGEPGAQEEPPSYRS
jgi:hypothetical protein